ncbi:MAG: hypothetical protein ACTSXA_00915 [Candidatus Heimdallarchaeota archaeon]
MSNDKEPSKPVEEKSDDEKYLFERITTRAEVETETEVEAQVESSTEELNDYYSAMETGPTEDDIYDSMKVKLKWSRVLIVGLIIGLLICAITLLIVWLVSRNGREHLWVFLPWIFFIIFGLMFIFGGCVGTVKQSFTIDAIRRRMAKGESITGADTKIAIGSAYTYILAGAIVGIASLIAWLVV